MRLQSLMMATALTIAACDSSGGAPEPSAPSAENEHDGIGTLALNLTGSDSTGRAYRLRSAEFLITRYYSDIPIPGDGGAYFETSVSSEDNLDEARITLKVIPGYYDISLVTPDWYLERNTGGTWERVEQAVLLSSTYQSAYVYNQSVSAVNFRFGVDGELIDFRSGDLSIGIQIEQPGEGPGDAGFPGGGFIGGLLGGGTFGGIVGGTTGSGGGTFGGGEFDAGIEE